MSRAKDTLETVQLVVEMLRRMPRNRKVTAKELHEQLLEAGFERDLRTIQRQLNMLAENFDIECDNRTRPYGYRWLADAKPLAVPSLTPHESLLLYLAEQHLEKLLPPRLMRSMQGFFSQAKLNLHNSSAKLERQWPKKVRVVETSQPLLPPQIQDGIFDIVSEALYSNHWLQLDYQNANGEKSQIEVMPLGLAQQGPRLYLVCRYKGFDNERSLALHRIQAAKMMSLDFDYPKEFDLQSYDKDGRFGFGEGKLVRLSFAISQPEGAHLFETPLSKDQKIKKLPDGKLKVSATVVDSTMLTWWLRTFGDAVSDIEKQDLQA